MRLGKHGAWNVAPTREMPRNVIAAIVAERPLVRYLWRVLDQLDYWVTQAKLRAGDLLHGPLPDCEMRD